MSSSSVYNDLLLKCQRNGKYRVFTFDIKESTKMPVLKRRVAQYQIKNLIERTYRDVEQLQTSLNTKILLKEDGFGHMNDTTISNDFALRYDPFLHGDTTGFTIYNNSLEPEVIYEIFKRNKKELNIDFDFHTFDAVYETHDYGLGAKLYFRGYCIDMLSKMHKKENIKIRKQLMRINQDKKMSKETLDKYMMLVNQHHDKAIEKANQILSINTISFCPGILDKNGNYIFHDEETKRYYDNKSQQKNNVKKF